MSMPPLPAIAFLDDQWFSWTELQAAFARPALKQCRGAYVVAKFDEEPPLPPSAMLPDERVVYIGETHGRSATLSQRLEQFGRSAGFYPCGQQNGHYAAWGVPALLNMPIESGQQVPSDDFWFAVVPDSVSEERTDQPGVFPVLVEALLLWQHVQQHEFLPDLNNAGRQVTDADVAAREAFCDSAPESAVFVLVDGEASSEERRRAAEEVLKALATSLGYGPARKIYQGGEDDSQYAGRHLGRGRWLYVGRSSEGAWVSLWRYDEICEFGPDKDPKDEGPVTSVEGLRELVGKMWDRWPG